MLLTTVTSPGSLTCLKLSPFAINSKSLFSQKYYQFENLQPSPSETFRLRVWKIYSLTKDITCFPKYDEIKRHPYSERENRRSKRIICPKQVQSSAGPSAAAPQARRSSTAVVPLDHKDQQPYVTFEAARTTITNMAAQLS